MHYYKEVQGVVFVVDAADTASFPEAKERLAEVLAHNDMKAGINSLTHKGAHQGQMGAWELESMGEGV